MSKYEYCLIDFREIEDKQSLSSRDDAEKLQERLIKKLNKKGSEGWHVVSHLGRAVGNCSYNDKLYNQHLLLERII